MNASAWRLSKFHRSTPVGLLCTLLAVAAPGHAEDEAEAADTAAARRLAIDGLKLAESGKCSEAIEKLTRAEQLHHAPIVLERLGECQVAVGKVVEGSESLRRVLREELPPNASPALSKAISRATTTLAAAKPKIAWLKVSVAPEIADAHVKVDGRPLSSTLLGEQRAADPGEHLVEASAPGFINASSSVALGEGETRTVSLQLELDPNAAGGRAETTGPKAERARAALPVTRPRNAAASLGVTRPSAPDHTAAYVTYAVSGLATGAGAVLGILAWQGKRDLSRECPALACPAGSLSKLEQSRRLGNLSTGAFAVAGAGLVIGTVLFATASPAAAQSSSDENEPARAWTRSGVRLHGFIGLRQVGIRGDF